MGVPHAADGGEDGAVGEVRAQPALVLIGAASRAGRAILRTWQGPVAAQVHRGQGPGILLRDYADVPRDVIPRGSVVVNCVGISQGPAVVLRRVNHDIPLLWAQAAAAAGADRFFQLSSFSVYGRAEYIDGATPERPETAYGQSKLAADRALLALARPGFGVTALRVPMLCGDGPDKLTMLVRAVQKLRAVPRTVPPIERAMLTYDGLAAALCQLIAQPKEGVVHVADPTPFSYELLADRVATATGRSLLRVRVPGFATTITRRFLRPFHMRLLASSRLDPAIAYRIALPTTASLATQIDRIIER